MRIIYLIQRERNSTDFLKRMSNVNLLDLPDEILLLILHKLTIIDMLYSLVNVNERFDRLVLNPSNISDLNLKNHSLVHYQSTSMK